VTGQGPSSATLSESLASDSEACIIAAVLSGRAGPPAAAAWAARPRLQGCRLDLIGHGGSDDTVLSDRLFRNSVTSTHDIRARHKGACDINAP
jgi:hypothetical protein